MYSAQGLVDGSFLEADLPDTFIYFNAEFGDLTFSKVPSYAAGFYTVYYTAPVPDPDPTGNSGTLIQFGIDPDPNVNPLISWERIEFWGDRYRNECLIRGDGNLTPGDDIVEDQFAATYSVTGTLTGTVTRSSLCDWSATGITLRFNSTTQKWNVNGNEKSSGNQSSPVGSYNGGLTVA